MYEVVWKLDDGDSGGGDGDGDGGGDGGDGGGGGDAPYVVSHEGGQRCEDGEGSVERKSSSTQPKHPPPSTPATLHARTHKITVTSCTHQQLSHTVVRIVGACEIGSKALIELSDGTLMVYTHSFGVAIDFRSWTCPNGATCLPKVCVCVCEYIVVM